MEITGEYRIPAPKQRVWDALNDPDVLKACIPGCEELEKVSETEFAARVLARIGAVKARFKGNIELSDIDAPNAYTLSGKGQGGVAGFAKGGARVRLDGDGNGGTVLRYEATADIGGKLAAVGSRVVQGIAKKTADDFFGAFAALVGGASEALPAAGSAPVPITPPEAEKQVEATVPKPVPGPTRTLEGVGRDLLWFVIGTAVGGTLVWALLT